MCVPTLLYKHDTKFTNLFSMFESSCCVVARRTSTNHLKLINWKSYLHSYLQNGW